MKDRIKQLMESQHMTQQSFSDFIGISSASLSSIFNGRTKPTLNTVEAIRTKFTKINLDWLLYGSGPMFRDDAINESENGNGGNPVPTEGMFDFGTPAPAPSYSNSGNGNNYGFSTNPKNPVRADLNFIDKPQRQITEIRIFFDDQTYESFVPKK